MQTKTPHIFAALFALLLTASLFQQAIVIPPAASSPIASYELA
jgi:hypothetical protein